MKLIILNAGIGSRLGNITKNKPKCLLNLINGYNTLLENQLQIFKNFEILLILGYKCDIIIDVIKNYKNVKYIINNEYLETNNMYSVNLAKNFIGNDSFFVLNGDIYIEDGILEIIKNMDLNYNSIFIDKYKFNEENMKVKVEEEYIIDIDKKLKIQESMGLSMDFYYIKDTQIYFDEINKYLKNEKNHWAELILKKMMKFRKFKPIYNNVFWYEIDTCDDYINYINKKNGFKKYDNYFLDIDGNLLLNNKLINNADIFLKNIDNFKLITNNSSKTKEIYETIFNNYNININQNNIINSIDSTIIYLNENKIKNIYLFSTNKVKEIFQNNNFNILTLKDIKNVELVVITYNTEYNYNDLINLTTVINQKEYIVTHMDQICPYEDFFIPDVGCLVDNIYNCLQKKPLVTCGKPNINLQYNGTAIIIGDNLDTDYKQSINSNADFCLTLTGRTKIEDLENKIGNLKKINVVNTINDFNFKNINMNKYLKYVCKPHFLDLLPILNKSNVNYFASSGTLLGAIRHNGIIPWDTDIDIGVADLDEIKKIARLLEGTKYYIVCWWNPNWKIKYPNIKPNTFYDYNDIKPIYNNRITDENFDYKGEWYAIQYENQKICDLEPFIFEKYNDKYKHFKKNFSEQELDEGFYRYMSEGCFYTFNNYTMNIPKIILKEFTFCNFYNRKIKIMKNYDSYCKTRWGDDYMTNMPVLENRKITGDKKINEFKPL